VAGAALTDCAAYGHVHHGDALRTDKLWLILAGFLLAAGMIGPRRSSLHRRRAGGGGNDGTADLRSTLPSSSTAIW
jgi:hypothetical protein